MKPKDEAKEQRIVAATLQLVAEIGMAGVTMSRVAKTAKISPSMIYTYFKNKEDLIDQVFRNCVKKLKDTLWVEQDPNLPFKTNFYNNFIKIYSVTCSQSVEYNFVRNFFQSPYFIKEMHHDFVVESFGHTLLDIFRDGQRQLIVKDTVDVYMLAALFIGFIDKLVEMEYQGIFKLEEPNLRAAFAIFWDGIRQ